MRYCFIPTGMATIKKADDDKDVEKWEPPYTAGGNEKGAATVGNR